MPDDDKQLFEEVSEALRALGIARTPAASERLPMEVLEPEGAQAEQEGGIDAIGSGPLEEQD